MRLVSGNGGRRFTCWVAAWRERGGANRSVWLLRQQSMGWQLQGKEGKTVGMPFHGRFCLGVEGGLAY